MEHNTFQKVKKIKKRMYGPEKLLVCGYSAAEHEDLLAFLEQCGLKKIPVVFVADEDSNVSLMELLGREDRSGKGHDSGLKRAIIVSGFTQDNLHLLISAYRSANFPPQLWATLTAISEGWSIGFLLQELEKEAEAMRKIRKK